MMNINSDAFWMIVYLWLITVIGAAYFGSQFERVHTERFREIASQGSGSCNEAITKSKENK
jgi:hypothetical protein